MNLTHILCSKRSATIRWLDSQSRIVALQETARNTLHWFCTKRSQ